MQGRQANHFFGGFSIFESGGITKHLMTDLSGNSEFFFFPLGLAETKLTFFLPCGQLLSAYSLPANLLFVLNIYCHK